jgi:malic enzyme
MVLIRMMSTPQPEIDPEDVKEVDQDYRCTVCGAELTMKAVNVNDEAAPRHCREDMVPVWRP